MNVATRKEVAFMAGVSESTVTRVLRGGYASPSVRDKVMEVINRVNYRPNPLAQGLRTKQTHQIACIAPSIDNSFYGQVMQGIEEVATRNEYVLTIYSSHIVDTNTAREVFSGRNDGVILLSPDEAHGWLLRDVVEKHMPMVAYWDWGTDSPFPSVSVDLSSAMVNVVQHLFELGHRRIGFISHTPHGTDPNPRLQGFRDAMAAKGYVVQPQHVQYARDRGTMAGGYSAMSELYHSYQDLTAVVASNDLLAFGIVRWLEDQGLRVPESISVVGCDDIAYSAMSNPPLTTIQIPQREIGNQLMNVALSLIRAEALDPASTHIELPVRVVRRGSTTNVRAYG